MILHRNGLMTYRSEILTYRVQPGWLLLVGWLSIAASNCVAWSQSESEPTGATVTVPRVLVTPISETEVPAQVPGVLAAVSMQVGDMIEAGAVLARVDDAEARMTEGLAEVALEIAEIEAAGEPLIEAAEAAYEVAKNNLRRAEESLENFRRSISQAELDDYRLKATEAKTFLWQQRRDVEVAGLTRRLRRQELELASDLTRRHSIVAPVGGMVKAVERELGEWVVPGQSIVTILRLDRLRCVGFIAADLVSEAPRRASLVGRDATLFIPAPDDTAARRFSGTVTFVDPEIEPESDQVRVWVEIENEDLRLRPGDRGTLEIDWPAAAGR